MIDEKQIDDILLDADIKWYIISTKTIPKKIKEKLKIIIKEMDEYNLDSNIYIHLKINKEYYIEVRKSYYKNNIYIVINKIFNYEKYTFDKYIKGNIIFNNIKEVINMNTLNKITDSFITHNDKLNKNDLNIKNMFNKYRFKTLREYTCSNRYDLLKSLFDIDKYNDKLKEFNQIKLKNNIHYILEVIEVYESMRIALTITTYGLKIFTYTTNDYIYNYIDKNRPYSLYNMYIHNQHNEFNAFEIMNWETFLLFYKNIDNFSTLNGFDNNIHDNDEVLTSKNKYKLLQAKEEKEKQIALIKNKKYNEAIENIENIPFIKNGISFEKNKIIYEGIVFDTNGIYNFKNYLKKKSIDDLADFNVLFNDIIKTIIRNFIYHEYNSCIEYSLKDKKNIKLYIDGKEIIIKKYKINNIRINKDEIIEALTHILCYKDLKSYESFLKEVSSCSLKFHKAISGGIKKTFKYIENLQTTIELKIIREKNKNYLIIGNKKFSIKDSNKIISDTCYNYEQFVKTIMYSTNLQFKDIKPLIKEGINRYTEALKKSQQLLDETLKLFKVKKETINDVTGWVVKGMSGRKYIINDENDNIKINEIIGDKLHYRCIVDRNSKNQIGKDRLVSRIYALANDSMVANDIHTIRQ